MKKLILLTLGIILSAGLLKAQSPLGQEGNQFKLASGYNTNGIPIFISYELAIPDIKSDITFGLEGAVRTFSENTDTATLSHTIVGFSFFSNYYFNSLLNMDPRRGWFTYGGVTLGYYKWFSPENYFELGQSSSTLAVGLQVGGQYYFKDWGIYLEFAGSTETAGGKLGVLYRFDY